MKLAELIDNLPVRLVRGPRESADQIVAAVVEDSRDAVPGCLFIARSGLKRDGREFIADAIASGASVVLTDDAGVVPEGVAVLKATDTPLAAALLAERFHGSPSHRLDLIGVTGTNGKTTTTHLVHQLLNGSASPLHTCGLIGTVQIDDGSGDSGARRPGEGLTTPPAVELSRLLRSMVDHGCDACVMEVSSHALDQQRVAALDFDIAVFTNLGGGVGDHMDYHGSMEHYIAAKTKLFEMARRFAIVNADDPAAAHFIQAARGSVLTCSLRDSSAGCHASVVCETITDCDVHFSGPWGAFDVRLPLCGRHNVMNALQAAAVAHVLGVDADALQSALASCIAPPGRLEPVTTSHDPFAVYVDYAHTDDALEHVLRTLRPLVPAGGRLHVVFGCGGDRDRSKRARMAAVACRYADEVVVTSDNPRTENPQRILDDIRAGVPSERLDDTVFVLDRAEAIETAIAGARDGDVVLVAGKGHEDYQIIGETKHPFDDRLVVAAVLQRLCQRVAAP
jgi:UDP-N-acetylmuramoyl-L-alanyl-D-glutamate--2,6-diaminopimelate ligase